MTKTKPSETAIEATSEAVQAGIKAIKIEDDVPIPNARTGWPASPFPFADMKPGQSFVFPIIKGDTYPKLRNRLHAASVRAAVVIVVRLETETAVRVWHSGKREPKETK